MRNFRARTPSPAMIIAVVALSMALAGTGVAATISALSKGEKKTVKKLANKQIRKKAGGLSVANADSAGSAKNVLAAEIPVPCTSVGGQTGGITAAAAGSECNVTFPRDVTNCAITLGTRLDFPGGGETTYRKPSANVVQVSRRDSAGGTPTAGAFSIAAICP